jgi:hypothetical protein
LCIEKRYTDRLEEIDLVGVLAAVATVADRYEVVVFEGFEGFREDRERDFRALAKVAGSDSCAVVRGVFGEVCECDEEFELAFLQLRCPVCQVCEWGAPGWFR